MAFKCRSISIILLLLCVTAHAQLRRVTLQLKWWHQFQFAGYYAADKLGYYKEAGLDVHIVPGDAKHIAVEEVLSGHADFGVTGSDLLFEYAKGKPLVALGAIFQHSPYVILSLTQSNIKSPSDLIGKKIMADEAQGWVELKALFLKEGIDPRKIMVVGHSWNNMDLASGKIAAMTGYRSVEPYQLAQRGYTVNMIEPITYGIDFYGDIIFSTRRFVKDNSAVVEKFREASFRGWEHAMSHKEELCDYILTLPGISQRHVTKAELMFEANEMEKLILPQLVEIGHMNEGRWEHILGVYQSLGLIPRDKKLNGFLFEKKPSLGESLSNIGLLILGAVAALFLVVLAYGLIVRNAVKRKTREQRSALEALTASEERYRTLIEQASDGIMSFDAAFRLTQVNTAARHLFGYDDGEMLQMKLTELLVNNQEENTIAFERLKENESLRSEKLASRKDGSTFIAEIHVTHLSNGNYISLILDVTERRTQEMERERRAKERERLITELSNSIKELKQFSYITSHDLRAPVTNLMALTRLIDPAKITDTETRKLVQGFETSTTELNNTLDDLVRILIIKDTSNLPLQKVYFTTVLQKVMKTVEPMIESSQALIETDFALCPDLPYNSAYLESILMNLLTNSIKYAQPGRQPKISIRTDCIEGSVYLYFSDNGRGFDISRIRERLFGLHQRFHHSPDSRGIGLYLVHSQITALGGTIEVESEVGRGTDFKICLRRSTSPQRLRSGG